jgi:hypothetical protein
MEKHDYQFFQAGHRMMIMHKFIKINLCEARIVISNLTVINISYNFVLVLVLTFLRKYQLGF